MGVWDVSADDLKQGMVVQNPTWYCTEISSSVLGTDRNGAGLWKLTAKILNAGEYQGVPIKWNYSEKAKGMSSRFLEALGLQIDVQRGARLNTDAAIGKRIEIYIAPREYEGRLVNDVKDARPCQHAEIPEGSSAA